MIWLRYSGTSIEEHDENAWIWIVPVDRCPRQFSRYVPTGSTMDRSLRRDQTNGLVIRYVATDSIVDRSLATDSLRIDRYIATDREAWSVAT
ncbi:hypothetical protein IGI04_023928 [Brassica rapa subsp. trilocularis]|uniref:Uncharacterized protein n=1 Tax=Brassica rapa subsp. trilocularis TaxID=1813537 RepID=A0ABQ7M6N3_BRACM|nr:hypothetical protein IGI04_023928 [Brassica rapa subsp. trilocularis]